MQVADQQVVIERQFYTLLTRTSNIERNKSAEAMQKSVSDC